MQNISEPNFSVAGVLAENGYMYSLLILSPFLVMLSDIVSLTVVS